MDANQEKTLEVNGNVRFIVADRRPRWPQQCVVCGETCAETRELDSTAEKNWGYKFYWTVKGRRSFEVPVHVVAKDCYRKLIRPMPLWGQAAWVLGGLSGGTIMGAIARPDWHDRIGAFVIFGAIALLLAWSVAVSAFQPGLAIEDLGELGYVASFKDAGYAQRFAELNRDIVQPWQRAAWDISINIFSKRKKRG